MGRPAKPWQRDGQGQWYATVDGKPGVKLGDPNEVKTFEQAEVVLKRLQREAMVARRLRCQAKLRALEEARWKALEKAKLRRKLKHVPDIDPQELDDAELQEFECVSAIGFRDTYNDLFVGPCKKRLIAKEVKKCALVYEINVAADKGLEEGSFDCSLEEWIEYFRDEVHAAEKRGWPGKADPDALLDPRHENQAALAAVSGVLLELDRDLSVRRHRGQWVLMRGKDQYLNELPDPFFMPLDIYGPPIYFPDARHALAAYLLVKAIYDGCEYRYKEALVILDGPSESGPSEI